MTLTAIRSIQNDRNRLAQILPELLSRIFGFLPIPSGHALPPDIHSLLAASQVCSRWRSIATANQSLWTDILVTKSGQLESLFLERSSSWPVRVFVPHTVSFSLVKNALTVALAPHRARVQQLTLRCPCTSPSLVFPDAFTLSQAISPFRAFLTCLRVITGPARRMFTISEARLAQANMNNMNRAPMKVLALPNESVEPLPLRALSISLHAITLPDHQFPSLAHLRIIGDNETGFGVRPSHLLLFLNGTPQLQTLYTEDLQPGDDTWTCPTPSTTIELPHLRALHLDHYTLSQAAFFLERVDIPPTTLVQLHRLNGVERSAHDLSDLEHLLETLPDLGEFTELEIAEHRNRHTHFRLRGAGSLWLHLDSHPGTTMAEFAPIVLAKLAHRIASLHTLRIAPHFELPTDEHALRDVLRTASEHAPLISTLVVASYNNEGRLGEYVQPALLSMDHDAPHPLPCLEHLVIQVFVPLSEYDTILRVAKQRRARTRLSRLTFSSPGARAFEGDALSIITAWEPVAKTLELTFSRERLWKLGDEPFWRGEGLNPYWSMRPEKYNFERVWRVPKLGYWETTDEVDE